MATTNILSHQENNENTLNVNSARIESGIQQSILTNNRDHEKKIKLCFAITNARSLWKKIQSMYDAFTELELDFMVVTETWFYKSPALEKLVCDAEQGQGLKLINSYRKKKAKHGRRR